MDLLLIAKRADVSLMFDVRDPPREHPFHGKSFEIVNKTIVESGFNTSKVGFSGLLIMSPFVLKYLLY